MFNQIIKDLKKGRTVLVDGATGTELERLGVPMDDVTWSARAILTHPHIVRQVHKSYIDVGASIIISNTFGASRHVLEPAGMSDEFEKINARAVQLALEARAEAKPDRPVVVAGSISTFMPENDETRSPSTAQLRMNFKDQAQIYKDAGADLIMMEMMQDIPTSRIAIEAARTAGLPIWVGFSTIIEKGKVVMREGHEPFEQALQDIPGLSDHPVLIMHTLTEHIHQSLDVLTRHHPGPIGVYAHSGKFVMPNWIFKDMITPVDYAAASKEWIVRGVQIVGGCCGTTPHHISALKQGQIV